MSPTGDHPTGHRSRDSGGNDVEGNDPGYLIRWQRAHPAFAAERRYDTSNGAASCIARPRAGSIPANIRCAGCGCAHVISDTAIPPHECGMTDVRLIVPVPSGRRPEAYRAGGPGSTGFPLHRAARSPFYRAEPFRACRICDQPTPERCADIIVQLDLLSDFQRRAYNVIGVKSDRPSLLGPESTYGFVVQRTVFKLGCPAEISFRRVVVARQYRVRVETHTVDVCFMACETTSFCTSRRTFADPVRAGRRSRQPPIAG